MDSALLLYYLLKADVSLTCYTMIDEGNKVNNNKESAEYIVNLMETKTSKKILGHTFQGYTKVGNDKREKMTTYYTNLINAGTIDCLITGTSQHLTSVEDTWNQKDIVKESDSVWNTANNVYRPFLAKDKSWIKTCCDSCNLTDELVKNTISCISTKITAPCKDCLWCAEKYASFGSY